MTESPNSKLFSFRKFESLDFEFVSDFVIRISDLNVSGGLFLLRLV
jgi:hypothetical protein